MVVYGYKVPIWAKNLKIEINQQVINLVPEVKYFGLILDGKLTWKSHSMYVQKKLRAELPISTIKKTFQRSTTGKTL